MEVVIVIYALFLSLVGWGWLFVPRKYEEGYPSLMIMAISAFGILCWVTGFQDDFYPWIPALIIWVIAQIISSTISEDV